MLIEIGLGIGAYALYKYLDKNSYLFEQQKEWNQLITDNKLEDYKLLSSTKEDYGYKYIINIKGLSISKLEKIKDKLESHFNATVYIEQSDKNKSVAIVSVITKKFDDNVRFKPIKCKPYELYLGKTYQYKDIIVSMKDSPHLLYTGINNSGKTYCVLTALTNLVYWHTKRDIELYLAQVSAKKDLRKFKDTEMTRGYGETMEDSYKIFSHLYNMMVKRNEIFSNVKGEYIDTIYDYNKLFPKKKMRICYLAMDEFTSYMNDNLDSKKDAKLKKKCLDLLLKIIQQGRSVGIYVLTSLQRSDRESLKPRQKAQFNVTVSFKQPNLASSLTTCDSDKAYYLKRREAIVQADSEYLIKTLYLDNQMIADFIKEKLDMTHSNYIKSKRDQVQTKEYIPPKVSRRIEGKNAKTKRLKNHRIEEKEINKITNTNNELIF